MKGRHTTSQNLSVQVFLYYDTTMLERKQILDTLENISALNNVSAKIQINFEYRKKGYAIII